MNYVSTTYTFFGLTQQFRIMPSGPTLEIPTSIGHNLRNVKYSCRTDDPFIQLYNDVMRIERKTGIGVTQLLIFMQVIYILHIFLILKSPIIIFNILMVFALLVRNIVFTMIMISFFFAFIFPFPPLNYFAG